MRLSAPLLIERTRDGQPLPAGAVRELVDGFLAGEVAPEQMSAWCMAVIFRGLADEAIDELCSAMLESGADLRMHVSNGAVASFTETLPLLHPFGRRGVAGLGHVGKDI